MNKRTTIIMITTSLLVAFLLSYAVYRSLRQKAPAPIVKQESFSHVVVARSNIGLGTRLKPEYLRTIDWPDKNLPTGYFAKVEDVNDRALLYDIRENEPILETKLGPKLLRELPPVMAGLPVIIPEGKRALSVRVNEVISVAGYVTPGTIVDVLITANPQDRGGNSGPLTKTILQNVPVLSAGQQLEHNPDGKPVNVAVVTLLVTPEEAEKLTLASSEGKIQLALRHPLDRKVEKNPGIEFASLVGEPKKAKPVAPKKPVVAPPPRVKLEMEVISGTKRNVHMF